jgi:TPR repeat protein
MFGISKKCGSRQDLWAEAEAAYASRDGDAALRAFEVLASMGDAEAQCRAGSLQKIFREDFSAAAKWYRLAADQGHAGISRGPTQLRILPA